MMRTLRMLAVVVMCPVCSIAQTTAGATGGIPSNGQNAAAVRPNQPVSAVLIKDVNAGRAKVGDAIKVTSFSGFTAADGTRVPPGSTLIGHVTEASRLGKGSIESRLGVLFDQAQLHSGQVVAMRMSIAGLATAPVVSGPEVQGDLGGDMMSPFPGANQTGARVDPRGVGGGISPRASTRSTAGTPRTTINLDDLAEPTIKDARGNRPAGVASVGSTISGIKLKGDPAQGLVLVSTSDTITLRSGTPLVLTAVAELQQH